MQSYVPDGQGEEPEPGNNTVDDGEALPGAAVNDFAQLYRNMLQSMGGDDLLALENDDNDDNDDGEDGDDEAMPDLHDLSDDSVPDLDDSGW